MILLAFLAVDYLVLQFHVLPDFRSQIPQLDRINISQLGRIAILELGPWLALAALILIVLAFREYRYAQIRRWVGTSSWRTVELTALTVCTVLSLTILAPGNLVRGDTVTHLERGGATMDALQEGELPTWSTRWYGGFPLNQFYSPLTNFLLGVTLEVGGGSHVGPKLILFIAYLSTAVGTLHLCRALDTKKVVALLAAIAVTIQRPHLATVMFQANFPGTLFLGVLPWAFLFALRTARRPAPRNASALALLLGACAAAHLGYLRPMSPIWAAWMGWLLFSSGTRPSLRSSIFLLLAHLAALLLASWLVIPIILERHLVHFPSVWGEIMLPQASLLESILVWAPFHPAFQGSSMVGLAAVGCVLAWRCRDQSPRQFFLVFGLFIAAIVCTLLFWPQNRTHYLLGSIYVLIGAVGFSVPCPPSRITRWTAPAIIAIFLLEHGPFLLMNSYAPGIHQPRGSHALERGLSLTRTLRTDRVIRIEERGPHWIMDRWWLPTADEVSTLSGPLSQGIPRAYARVEALTRFGLRRLQTNGPEDRWGRRALTYLGISGVVHGDEWLLAIPEASWARFAPKVTFVAPDDDSDVMSRISEVFENAPGMHIDEFLVLSDSATDLSSSLDAVLTRGNATPDTLIVERHATKWTIEIETPVPGFLQLAATYYPHLVVDIDGRIERPLQDAFGTMVIPVSAGRHHIEVRPRLTAVREALAAVATVTVLVLLIGFRSERPNRVIRADPPEALATGMVRNPRDRSGAS